MMPLVLLVASALNGVPVMVPQQVPAATAFKFGAKQLNGDAPLYLIRRNNASSKYILFLEGGGWCFGSTASATIADCARRGGFKTGSTSGEPSSPEQPIEPTSASNVGSTSPADYGGLMSMNCTKNPDFCSWNMVFLHYKDGASFGSNRPDPIAVDFKNGTKGAQMWMRGRPSFDAIIQDLGDRFGFTTATEVILSGGSAGGLAVFYNLDHLATLLPATVTKFVGFPDAGFFLDAKNVKGEYFYRSRFIAADPVWNVTASGGTNLACLAANAAANTQWKCLMAEYIVPHLKTPLFVMNSAYDAYQLPNILQTPCPVSDAVKQCDDTAAQAYGTMFKQRVRDTVLAASPKNGAFVDSCWVHEQNVNYCENQGVPNCVGWSPIEPGSMRWGYTTAVDGLTPQDAFGQWYRGTPTALVDTERLQTNPTCHFLGKPK
jgi:hypothetical protein